MWLIGIEVEQETSAPPPPGSAPVYSWGLISEIERAP